MSWLLLLRWSLRDLRRRWLQVAAIALVIAIGTGVYAAMGSTSTWRRASNDASFAATAMYDLRVRATEGAFVEQGALLAALDDALEAADQGDVVELAEERLVVATQVDASTPEQTVLVPGRIIGVDVRGGGPQVAFPAVAEGDGRVLADADDGNAVAVLEYNFAAFYELRDDTDVTVSGGRTLDVVGLGLAPEYFLVTTEEGGFLAQANFAALFVPLATAQDLAGRPGEVNDLVLRLRPGADREQLAQVLRDAFDASSLGLGVTVMTSEDDDSYRLLYDDIEGDQKVNDVFAMLVLLGAVFGAFNLSSRMVEAQRREIGISMAIGASRRQLATRPLLVGVEIALLGALLGMAVGAVVIEAIRPVWLDALPLPVWRTDFQWATFAEGAALGFALPLVATAWPVWRAVRTTPVEAIATTHRNPRSGLSRALRHLRWPRRALNRMPLGNVLRTPRRTLLTSLGIGAAIATLVGVLGLLDSFFATIDANDREVLAEHPDRVVVGLDGLTPADGSALSAIAAAEEVGTVEPVLRVGGRLRRADAIDGGDDEGFEVLIEALDLDNEVWTPGVVEGDLHAEGIVISRVAADDLGVGTGDTVVLVHPAITAGGFVFREDEVVVAAVNASPYRFGVYVDSSLLGEFGAEGLANQAYVLPAAGYTPEDVQRSLFFLPGVTSVQPVATASEVLRDTMKQFTGIFRVLEGFILLLALLIAYNSTSINADERARERATLFAIGMSRRRVIVLEVAEGLMYGLLGTAAGLAVGSLVVRWIVTSVVSSTMPEMGMEAVMSGTTVLTAVVMGVVAVAVAPLLTVRRLRRMDVPGTLRVVE